MTVAIEELKQLKADKVVDARGTSCPGPILAAKKNIGQVPVGGIMEVLATDSGTKRDLPAWSKKMGHDYLGDFEDSGYLRLFLKKVQ
ncbi:MAG: sulfurtransferase TusA family protein [Acidimicrobiales bacterium]